MNNKKQVYMSADWHITTTAPQARIETDEEWFEFERQQVRQVANIVKADLLIISGDIIHNWKPKDAEKIVNMLHDELPPNVIWIFGNHELLGASKDFTLAEREGTAGTLMRMNGLTFVKNEEPFIWGDFIFHAFNFDDKLPIDHITPTEGKFDVALTHYLSYEKEIPFYVKETALLAEDVLKEYPEFNFILTGDNHSTFNIDNNYLSPGSLLRRTVKQMKHKPCIHRYDGVTCEPVYLDVPEASLVLSRDHLDKKEAKEGRFDDWAESVENSDIEDLDIESGIHNYFLKNEARKNTKDLILSLIENVK